MNVKVHLLSQSQPVERSAVNTYTKDGLYCVFLESGEVEKYPLCNIFRAVEDYR